MTQSAHDRLDLAIREAEKLRRVLKNGRTAQVRSKDEREVVKATSLAWFNNHLPELSEYIDDTEFEAPNEKYHILLDWSEKATTRSKYGAHLKILIKDIKSLRRHIIVRSTQPVQQSSDVMPKFDTLIGDTKMQRILAGRWKECALCIEAGAPLAALVMMGGFLETLLLARFNKEHDKSAAFSATAAPIDRKTKKPLPLQNWTLRNYLDVGHELGWISRSTKDVGEVVRDYRNYVHPYKQASHGVTITLADAALFWEISKQISRQLLEKPT